MYNEIEKEWIVEVYSENEVERERKQKKSCASLRINYQALGIIYTCTAPFFSPHSPHNNWILSVLRK